MEHVTGNDILEATGGRLLGGDPARKLKEIRLDSRDVKPGDLFVTLIGEQVDAHRFLPQVAAAGAGAVLLSDEAAYQAYRERAGKSENGTAWILVPDTKKALQDVGRFLRKRLTLPLVGVTGSVGKTTTREMIAAALSAKFQTFKTPGNSNSQVGVPVTISQICPEDEAGVIELGMSEPGELTVIAKIAKIDIAVITNIGLAHIGQLGSQENIFREKMTIQDGLRDGGVLILNGDDEFLKSAKGREGVKTIYYGTGENCEFRAEDIVLKDGKAWFTAVHGGERTPVHLNVMGLHLVQNAMAAIAVCAELGMTMEEAARGLLTFDGFQNRQQLCRGERMTILNDSYNASPSSMRAALDVLRDLSPENRHVAVLADMKELGENSPLYHRQVGEYAAKTGLSLLVTLGTDAKEIAAGAREKNPGIETAEFDAMEDLAAYLDRELKDGDCVLFKGSNSMKLSPLAAEWIKKAGPERN